MLTSAFVQSDEVVALAHNAAVPPMSPGADLAVGDAKQHEWFMQARL
jgi:hypothetical protein